MATTLSASLSEMRNRLRASIGDETATGVVTDYTDVQLNDFLARAVEKYSALNPHVKKYAAITVAGQYLYQLPSDAAMLTNVKWRYTMFGLASNVAPSLRLEWRDNALLDVRDQIIANFDRATRTSWAQTNNVNSWQGGSYMVLYPTPVSDGEDIEAWYTTMHPLNADGTAYDTIPSEHIEKIVLLATAITMRREARIMLRQPDVAGGQGLRIGSKPGQILMQEAQYIEQQVADSLTIPVGAH